MFVYSQISADIRVHCTCIIVYLIPQNEMHAARLTAQHNTAVESAPIQAPPRARARALSNLPPAHPPTCTHLMSRCTPPAKYHTQHTPTHYEKIVMAKYDMPSEGAAEPDLSTSRTRNCSRSEIILFCGCPLTHCTPKSHIVP